MPEISMKNMLEAGVHFGHQTHRWNPKMKSFIFGPRNGIHIIDLEKTVKCAKDACDFIKSTVSEGGKVLFVATKKQAKEATKQAAERVGMPYVTERWLGGMLTNFQTIRLGCDRLDELDRWKQDGTYDAFTKKEIVRLERKRKKLDQGLGGVRSMKSLPQALFVVDPETERIAVREAKRLGIPIVAVVDTNCDPDWVDYVIPGNDDALKSVGLFVNLISEACAEGGSAFEQKMRQAGISVTPTPKKEEAAAPAAPRRAEGPIVERVVRRQLRNIPTDIDYRAEGVEDDGDLAAEAEEQKEAESEEEKT